MTITPDQKKKKDIVSNGEFDISEKEIFKYISDKRMLRALFEDKIFALRAIQKEAIEKGLFFRKSFLVCAPSGSGKTLIGELCAINNVFQKFGKSAYLVPYKALASEKFFHFKKYYEKYGVRVELSIGDNEIEDSKIEKADVIVTTYEKMDSILRNFFDKEWIKDISTVIIDEIHVIGEESRGPRLESLIVRLNEFLHNPQLIGLSATIANPDIFNKWLSSLGNDTILVKSEERPVPLYFFVEVAHDKNLAVKKIANKTLEKQGQVLVFLNKRRSTQQLASNLTSIVKKTLTESESKSCEALQKKIEKIKGRSKDLADLIKFGIAFHHAGLLPKERKLVEDYFRAKTIKVVCCTTTLSAGINMPARVVILRDYKKHVLPGREINDFSGYYENGDGYTYFKPFSANEVFQILGRAGRPGLDKEGFGVILTTNQEEKAWVEDRYFSSPFSPKNLIPKYDDVKSALNNVHMLKEQVLLRVFEENEIILEDLIAFFKKTYFWFENKTASLDVPIEQLLMIKEISPTTMLKLHADPEKVIQLKGGNHIVNISKVLNSAIMGSVKNNFGIYLCRFDAEQGIQCSCGFKNAVLSDHFANQKLAFKFCDHVTIFLMHLLQINDPSVQNLIYGVVSRSTRHQYVLDYLFEKGLIVKNSNNTIRCTQFGKMVVRLYLHPVIGVSIREKLEHEKINSFRELIKEACEILTIESGAKGRDMLQPLVEWCDEEPLDQILERNNIFTGDLFSFKEGLERILFFINIIGRHLSEENAVQRDKMTKIVELTETFSIRLRYGIKEELFDLVLRLHHVARARARILFNAGYFTADQVKNEKPRRLSQKTGLSLNLCVKIIRDSSA